MGYTVYINFSTCEEIWCNLGQITPQEVALIVNKREEKGGILTLHNLYSINGVRWDIVHHYICQNRISLEKPQQEQWLPANVIQRFLAVKMQEFQASVGQLERHVFQSSAGSGLPKLKVLVQEWVNIKIKQFQMIFFQQPITMRNMQYNYRIYRAYFFEECKLMLSQMKDKRDKEIWKEEERNKQKRERKENGSKKEKVVWFN